MQKRFLTHHTLAQKRFLIKRPSYQFSTGGSNLSTHSSAFTRNASADSLFYLFLENTHRYPPVDQCSVYATRTGGLLQNATEKLLICRDDHHPLGNAEEFYK